MDCENTNYRWIILVTVTVSHGLTYGLAYSVGVLYKDWTRYFDSPASFLSLIGSSPVAMSIAGPIFGLALDNLNYRKCGFLGGLIMAIGMATSSVVEDAVQLLFTFGVIGGFGLGLHFYVSCTIINEYFVENRLLAEGFLGCGLGIGTFLFSWFQQFLSSNYTWKGSILICGAITLHLCLISMFFISSKSIWSHPFNFGKNHEKVKQKEIKVVIDVITKVEPKCCKNYDVEIQFEKKRNGFFRRSWILWQNPLFLMIIVAEIFTWFAVMITYVQLVDRGRVEGLDDDTASWLSATIGIVGIVSKPTSGFFLDYFRFHPLWVYCINQLCCGLVTIISTFWSSKAGLFTFAVLFGILSQSYGYIKASAAKLLEHQCFADAFSWMLFVEGIASFAGPFIAGYLFDATQSYDWSFRLSGLLLVLSGLVCFLKPFAQRYQDKRIHKATSSARSQYNGKENVVFEN